MSEKPEILKEMDAEAIKWQNCAICGQQKQRIVHYPSRPDYAICDHCQSAFVLESGGQMRMFYGQIGPTDMPKTHDFALRQWRKYFEIRAMAEPERTGQEAKELPAELRASIEAPIHGAYANHDEAILALEAQKVELIYARAKKTEAPPRPLRETGALPDLDSLFQDPDEHA
jgi:hypothetical protein